MRASTLLLIAATTLAQQVAQQPPPVMEQQRDPPPLVYEQKPPVNQGPPLQAQPVQPQLVQHPNVQQQQPPAPPQYQQHPVPPQYQQASPQQAPPQHQQMPPNAQAAVPPQAAEQQRREAPPSQLQQQAPPPQQQHPQPPQYVPPPQPQAAQQQQPHMNNGYPPQQGGHPHAAHHQQQAAPPPGYQQPGAPGVPHPHGGMYQQYNMQGHPAYGGVPPGYHPAHGHPGGMEQPPNIQMQPANVVNVNPIHNSPHRGYENQPQYQGPPPGAYHPGYGAVGGPPEPLGHPAGPMRDIDLPDEEFRKLQAQQIYHGAGGGGAAKANETENLAVEWERVMTDFLPDMIVTFRLAAGAQEYFNQDVGKESVLIRGGFFESTDEHSGAISFQIVSPSGKVAYQSTKGEGLFRITTEEQGTYTFAVSNTAWSGHKFVTFVVGAGVQKQLTATDVQTLDGNIQVLYRMLGDMETQSSYLWVRQKSHLEGVNATAKRTYHALIVGLVITGLATIFQLNIIKRMVAHRRMF